MERTKLLTISVIGLLVLNLATLGFLFFNGPKSGRLPHEGKPEPKEIIIEKLHFDSKQKAAYEKLIQWHRSEIDYLDNEIRHKKYMYYSILRNDSMSTGFEKTKQRLLKDLSHWEMQVEETHFKHFQDIRKLCNKAQVKDFDKLVAEFPKIFAPHKPRRPKHD